MVIFRKGDRVYHKEFQEFGTLTEAVSEYSSLILLDDDTDTNQELEVSTSVLIQIRDSNHENILRETYNL